MKKVLTIFLAVLFLFSFAACGEEAKEEPVRKNKAQVIILAGQSNMEGWSLVSYAENKLSGEEYALYDGGAPNVRIAFYKDTPSANGNPFKGVSFGGGVDGARFGPEVGIARILGEKKPSVKYYLIKYAVGGTSLYADWRSPSSGQTGKCYTAMAEYVSSALSYLVDAGVNFEIGGFCFMQGEADTGTASVAAAYGETLAHFIADIRSLLSFWAPEGGIPFIDGLISDSSLWPCHAAVNDAKRAAAAKDEKYRLIDTLAAGLEYSSEPVGAPDLAHYDALSMIKLGEMFGDAIAGGE